MPNQQPNLEQQFTENKPPRVGSSSNKVLKILGITSLASLLLNLAGSVSVTLTSMYSIGCPQFDNMSSFLHINGILVLMMFVLVPIYLILFFLKFKKIGKIGKFDKFLLVTNLLIIFLVIMFGKCWLGSPIDKLFHP